MLLTGTVLICSSPCNSTERLLEEDPGLLLTIKLKIAILISEAQEMISYIICKIQSTKKLALIKCHKQCQFFYVDPEIYMISFLIKRKQKVTGITLMRAHNQRAENNGRH